MNTERIKILLVAYYTLTLVVLVAVGCKETGDKRTQAKSLRLATTTSVRDSGLLEKLLPPFEAANGCRIDVVAVGTGAALTMGQRGDADVLIVHAPENEAALMKSGAGKRRVEFMQNYFILLGPDTDPAKVSGLPVADMLQQIAENKSRFVSRGDQSGTHVRELTLWQQAGGLKRWDEYIETGRGMGTTLIMADNLNSYLLCDQGTWLKFKDRIDLVPISQAAPDLLNRYSVIVISHGAASNSEKSLNDDLADAFANYITSVEAGRIIADHRIADQSLFMPNVLRKTPTSDTQTLKGGPE